MSKIKDLKLDSENVLNLVDVLSLFTPKGKSKYVDLLLKVVKNTNGINEVGDEIKTWLKDEFEVDEKELSKYTPFQLFTIHRFITSSFENEDLKKFIKFCEYNERGLIQKNDVTTYTNFDQILSEYEIANDKIEEKELEKQIQKIYEDDTWLSLRPLTAQASLKYGSNTKWCTATKNEPYHFLRYTKRGILIYNINKVTGLKVAVFYSLDPEHEFSFWNQKDVRIDSLESELPENVLKVISDEIKNKRVTNFSLLDNDEKKRQENLTGRKSLLIDSEEPQPMMEEETEEVTYRETETMVEREMDMTTSSLGGESVERVFNNR